MPLDNSDTVCVASAVLVVCRSDSADTENVVVGAGATHSAGIENGGLLPQPFLFRTLT